VFIWVVLSVKTFVFLLSESGPLKITVEVDEIPIIQLTCSSGYNGTSI